MRYRPLAAMAIAMPLFLASCGGSHPQFRPDAPADPTEPAATELPPASPVLGATFSFGAPTSSSTSSAPQPATAAPASRGQAPTATPPLPPAKPNQLTVTRQDDRKTLMASVGDSILVQLGGDFRWRLEVPDPSFLAPLAENLPPGSQGQFVAVRPGEVELQATGTANCPPGSACPLFALPFRVDIVIR